MEAKWRSNSTGSAEGYGASVEQGGVEGADGFRVEDACVFLCGGFVKGGEAVDVRGGADYGLSAGDAGYAPGQPVGASEMPGGRAITSLPLSGQASTAGSMLLSRSSGAALRGLGFPSRR